MKERSQSENFIAAAREAKRDESESAFNAKLGKVAKVKPESEKRPIKKTRGAQS